jgi:hypothetical protein
MGNRLKSTPRRRQAILELLKKGHGFEYAARHVGVSGSALRKWRHDDPAFAEACQAACDYVGDLAESALLARGLKNDTLALLAWLRAHRPHLYYRKMMVAVGGDPDSPPISVEHTLGKARLVILPDNHRRAMSEAEIEAEREAVRESHLLEGPLLEAAEADEQAQPGE